MQKKILEHNLENIDLPIDSVVIVRVDYNVPNIPTIKSRRFLQSLKTIEFLKNKGYKIIILSHRGNIEDSLLSFVDLLREKKIEAVFCQKPNIDEIKKEIFENRIVLVENIRRNDLEEKNDENFSKELASLASAYINDAFSVSHRQHSSIVGLPKYLPSFFGFGILSEIYNLSNILEKPKHPFLFISGGAKIKTKIPLLKNFFNKAEYVFVAGALANSFFSARGFETGISLADNPELAQEFLGRENLFLPIDVVVTGQAGIKERLVNEVKKDENIVDVGPKTMDQLKDLINESKMILWNGPLGNYENGFDKTTKDLLLFLANSKAEVYLGGGDTLVFLEESGNFDKYTFISTGGGATLDFLAFGDLVGISSVINSPSRASMIKQNSIY